MVTLLAACTEEEQALPEAPLVYGVYDMTADFSSYQTFDVVEPGDVPADEPEPKAYLESNRIAVMADGKIVQEEVPALSALNMRLRDDYVADCQGGVSRWNKVLEKYNIPFQLKLPHVAFHRHIGEFSSIKADADGNVVGKCSPRDHASWLVGRACYR